MAWNDLQTIVLTGSPTADPDDVDALDVEIAMLWFVPKRRQISSRLEYNNGLIDPGTATRQGYEGDCLPFTTLTQGLTGAFQDFGRYLLLETILLGEALDGSALYPYRFLKATYRSGANHGLGEIRRSGLHATDADGADDYWSGVTLPRLVVLDGDLDLQKGRSGKSNLSFRLVDALPISSY
jgi:hypothetical protein